MAERSQSSLVLLLSLAVAGCGSQGTSASPAPVGSFLRTSAQATVLGLPEVATSPVIYVAQNDNEIVVLSQRGRHEKLGVIRDGVRRPRALWDDANGNLYVANYRGTVSVYAPGRIHPTLTLSKGLTHPIGVAVDEVGTVYVSDQDKQIVEYPAGGSDPSLIIPPQMPPGTGSGDTMFPNFETIGPSGDLFVAYDAGARSYIADFAPGSTTPQFTGIVEPLIQGLVFDKLGKLVLGVPYVSSGPAGIFVFQLDPLKQVASFGDQSDPYALAMNVDGDRLYDSDTNDIFIYAYPRGNRIDTIHVGTSIGIALNPHLPL